MINSEWNDAKAASNFKKHRVTFDEAVTVFGDSLAITFADSDHEDGDTEVVHTGCRRAVGYSS